MFLTRKLILAAAMAVSLFSLTTSFADNITTSDNSHTFSSIENRIGNAASKVLHQSLTSLSNMVRGTNPINVTASPSGLPAQTTIGNSYVLTYTLTNTTPYPKTIINIATKVTAPGFIVNASECNNVTLQQGGTCSIDVEFRPTVAGNASAQVKFQYGHTVIPITPVLSTVVQGSSSGGTVTGTVTGLPGHTTVGSSYENVTFTFTNNSVATGITGATNAKSGSSDFTITSNGCGSSLAAQTPCSVVGTFAPTVAGNNQNMTITYTYDGGAINVPVTAYTNVRNSTGDCADVTGSTALLLPTNTYIYADNMVKYVFSNNCTSSSATLGPVVVSATLGDGSLSKTKKAKAKVGADNTDVSSWVTQDLTEDTCSHHTLAPSGDANDTCYVLASVVPASTGGPLIATATVSYTQSAQTKQAVAATTSAVIQANDSTNRMISVVNQCPYNVWMTFQAAAVPGVADCTTKSNCPQNSTCLTTAAAGHGLCYWNNPAIPGGVNGSHGGGFLAQAVSGQAPDTVDIPVSESNGGTTLQNNILYNAGIAARLGCTGTPGTSDFSCTNSNCGGTNPMGTTGSDGMCNPGINTSSSPGMSFNAVEFTFLRAYTTGAVDGVYDEQAINGVNVPLEMKGRGPSTVGTAPFYNCPGAGAVIQPSTGLTAENKLGGCNYNYSTPTGLSYEDPANYKFVTYSSGTSCDADTPCSSGTCGISYTGPSPASGLLTRTCGAFQGYISVNTGICSRSSGSFSGADLYSDYSCGTTPVGTPSSYADLYACQGSVASNVSCYTQTDPATETTCCGCQNWWSSPTDLTVPTATKSCGSYSNSNWTGTVLPQVSWMKSACPTAYAYQFDDESSQFYCTVTNASNTEIVTNYQVTFCPGGKYLTGS